MRETQDDDNNGIEPGTGDWGHGGECSYDGIKSAVHYARYLSCIYTYIYIYLFLKMIAYTKYMGANVLHMFIKTKPV